MKAALEITRELATIHPPLRWHWFVVLTSTYQGGHIFASQKIGSVTRIGAFFDFLRHGLIWLIRAWRIPE